MTSVIEEDLTLEGDIKSNEGTVEVKGKVLGNIAAASVVLHQSGAIEGAIAATSVSLEGSYQGTLKGDISAKTMTTENGAILIAKVSITGTD